MREHLELRSRPERRSGSTGKTAGSDRESSLAMFRHGHLAQPQTTPSLADWEQVQLSPQSQVGPQAQALVWSMVVI